jgi:hypothetical protein
MKFHLRYRTRGGELRERWFRWMTGRALFILGLELSGGWVEKVWEASDDPREVR